MTQATDLRRQAVQESEAIIRQKVGHFLGWWDEERARCIEPSSSALAAAP
ncbi:MAG: hypothetical protein HYZ95_00565 [Candidatus Omnitrophica bacterium]|nr:hypothetical protein [Candidatus Omnitrophota bacterium]